MSCAWPIEDLNSSRENKYKSFDPQPLPGSRKSSIEDPLCTNARKLEIHTIRPPSRAYQLIHESGILLVLSELQEIVDRGEIMAPGVLKRQKRSAKPADRAGALFSEHSVLST